MYSKAAHTRQSADADRSEGHKKYDEHRTRHIFFVASSCPAPKYSIMVVCKHFLHGRCQYGDYCRDEHRAQEPDVPAPARRRDVDLRIPTPIASGRHEIDMLPQAHANAAADPYNLSGILLNQIRNAEDAVALIREMTRQAYRKFGGAVADDEHIRGLLTDGVLDWVDRTANNSAGPSVKAAVGPLHTGLETHATTQLPISQQLDSMPGSIPAQMASTPGAADVISKATQAAADVTKSFERPDLQSQNPSRRREHDFVDDTVSTGRTPSTSDSPSVGLNGHFEKKTTVKLPKRRVPFDVSDNDDETSESEIETESVELGFQSPAEKRTLFILNFLLDGDVPTSTKINQTAIDTIYKKLVSRCSEYDVRRADAPADQRPAALLLQGRSLTDIRHNYDYTSPDGIPALLSSVHRRGSSSSHIHLVESALKVLVCWNPSLFPELTDSEDGTRRFPLTPPGPYESTIDILRRWSGHALAVPRDHSRRAAYCDRLYETLRSFVTDRYLDSPLLTSTTRPNSKNRRWKRAKAPTQTKHRRPGTSFLLDVPISDTKRWSFVDELQSCMSNVDGNHTPQDLEAMLETRIYKLAKIEPKAFPELFGKSIQENDVISRVPTISHKTGWKSRVGDEQLRVSTPVLDLLWKARDGDYLTRSGKKHVLGEITKRIAQYLIRSNSDPRSSSLRLKGRFAEYYRIDFTPQSDSSASLWERFTHSYGLVHRTPTRAEAEDMLSTLATWNPCLFPGLDGRLGPSTDPTASFRSTLAFLQKVDGFKFRLPHSAGTAAYNCETLFEL